MTRPHPAGDLRPAERRLAAAGRLRDGTPVQVRPLAADDAGLLVEGFRRLGGDGRRSRFLRSVSEAQFGRMLPVLVGSVDQDAHVALLLYAEGSPIGVGRLRRYPGEPEVADLAVTVVDEWRGRGAGSILARETVARAGGVRWLRTEISEDNAASYRMLARLGALSATCTDGTCEVTVRLRTAGDPAAEEPGSRHARAAARQGDRGRRRSWRRR